MWSRQKKNKVSRNSALTPEKFSLNVVPPPTGCPNTWSRHLNSIGCSKNCPHSNGRSENCPPPPGGTIAYIMHSIYTRYPVPGTRYSVLGTRYPVPGTRFSVLGTLVLYTIMLCSIHSSCICIRRFLTLLSIMILGLRNKNAFKIKIFLC